ncbi:type II secretion system F family protein [Helicobacter cappadocius]|uniref:Type II secretion system F family protein n=1 Tax=Helicobacter cappadocius TaxID=3063998 RepID=A0AA90Q206_9HELI|nr:MULTISPECIES: type II secretion system F family protein [unclassified Helicobacter]MDO7253121.1 type II secretion system F family protein [Helicobacter sp. faydin-H75]MDP2538753.1 type II secretion system F family protein [Helicobacter sp. faydin-H76]
MSIFYLFSLIFGFFGLFYGLYENSKIKKIHILFGKTQKNDFFTKNYQKHRSQEILEKSDTLLKNIRLYDENITFKILSAFMVFLLTYVCNIIFSLHISQALLGMIGIIAILTSFLAPSYLQKIIIDSRIQKISRDIPMFVDLLAICVQSGMNIEGAIKFLEGSVGQINKGFAPFLSRIVLKSEISGLEVAIDDLQKELPSTEISMMCATLKQSLRYGSGIYETLMNLSMEIRELELLKTEEAIGKLSAKMSIPLILFFMFPVIIIIAAPGVMKVLKGF